MHVGLGRSFVHVGLWRSCVNVGLGRSCVYVRLGRDGWSCGVGQCDLARCGPNLWGLASCVCGVGEGCGGIVVGDGGVLTQWYAACFCGKANL